MSGPRRQGRHLAPSWLQRRHTGVVDPDPVASRVVGSSQEPSCVSWYPLGPRMALARASGRPGPQVRSIRLEVFAVNRPVSVLKTE